MTNMTLAIPDDLMEVIKRHKERGTKKSSGAKWLGRR